MCQFSLPAAGPVVVVGGGTMGVGIAVAMLLAGERVTVVETDEARAVAAGAAVDQVLARAAERTGADAAEVRARLDVRVGLPVAGEAGLVVEAVFEDPAVKADVLRAAEAAFPDALLASNTSSLSIDAMAAGLRTPARFLGMHFFNPVPSSLLVELVVGSRTAPDAVDAARSWVERLRKTAVVVRDSPGFATSRLGVAIGLEAIRMLEEGVASADDIDNAMVLGYRFPVGPLRLTDLVGLDVRLAIADHLAATLGDRFTAPSLLREKVAAGELGKKAGKGFYTW